MDDFFELYRIPRSFHPDAALVKQQYYALSRQYHPDRFATANAVAQAEALQMAALNNEACKTFSNPDRVMAYILKLHGVLEEEEQYTLPPDFLMEMMELNEAIDEAPELGIRNWELGIGSWAAAAEPLMQQYNAGDHSPELLKALKDAYFRKKYLLRMGERLKA